jgi:hypothetical protein
MRSIIRLTLRTVVLMSATLSFNLPAAEEPPKAAERAPKGVEKAKQIQKYDTDGDAKLDAKEKGKVQADKTKLLKEVRPQREAELTPAQREAEKAKLLEKKSN